MPDASTIGMSPDQLDLLMPMHVLVSPSGHIARVGPTLAKFRPEIGFVGARFLELFRIRRPHLGGARAGDLAQAAGNRRLQLEMRDSRRTALRGILIPLNAPHAFLVNLSFGIATLARLEGFDLSSSDFAATDHTIEILYLQEAKSVVEAEYRRLTALLKTSKDAAEIRALTDPLTGLGNRAAMEADLDRLVGKGSGFSLIQVDLDLFKSVNDRLGHAAGDAVLCEAGRRLRGVTRDGDCVSRTGGDEFVVLADGLTDRRRLGGLCRTIIRSLEKPIPFEGERCRISASVGYAAWRGDDPAGAAALMLRADTALYAAKRAGRGRAVGYSPALAPLNDEAAARASV